LITTQFDYRELFREAVEKKTNVLRILFDTHIYKIIRKEDFVSSSRSHNNSMVQISDLGTETISVRVKTQGVNERIVK
jgi:hypothetical protein